MSERVKEFCIRGADQWCKHAGLPTYSELQERIEQLDAVIRNYLAYAEGSDLREWWELNRNAKAALGSLSNVENK